ncbi:MAG: rhomboid family intramembrane serine protease [Gemmatimonadales bacterium]|jgi:membrane associated rhomboid family serine protease|nr:MAG: rhomboid family intramembrane serine protease [Gemmatimonadales bacterium]
MFPLRDDNPAELPPIITVALILATTGVWIGLQGAGFSQNELLGSVCGYGAIPAELTGEGSWGTSPCVPGGLRWSALLTSIFLHGGWGHLVGNMWFLWIFGNNVEDSMGHLRFLAFYLLTGLIAAGSHVLAEPGSAIPIVGASGAISAIMGAYLVLYPRARVKTLIFLFLFITVIELPAFLYLGYWFLLQLLGTQAPVAAGGVAFWAHVGGFVAGVVLVILFRDPRLVQAKRAHVRLPRDQIRHGGWL